MFGWLKEVRVWLVNREYILDRRMEFGWLIEFGFLLVEIIDWSIDIIELIDIKVESVW